MQDWPEVESSFSVSNLSLMNFLATPSECQMSFFQKLGLYIVGFKKISCPFGILLATTKNYPDNGILYGANLIGNLLDPDGAGEVTRPVLQDARQYMRDGYFLGGGLTKAGEKWCDYAHFYGFNYCFSFQTWKAYYWGQDTWQDDTSDILTEETFHFFTQIGLGEARPNEFGTHDFTSSICQEMALHTCTNPGWWHEENTCPNGPQSPGNPENLPLEGTCNTPNCDCIEFINQAAQMYVGQDPGWLSPYMPTNQNDMANMLSSDFKTNVLDNPDVGLPTAPFNGGYTHTLV